MPVKWYSVLPSGPEGKIWRHVMSCIGLSSSGCFGLTLHSLVGQISFYFGSNRIRGACVTRSLSSWKQSLSIVVAETLTGSTMFLCCNPEGCGLAMWRKIWTISSDLKSKMNLGWMTRWRNCQSSYVRYGCGSVVLSVLGPALHSTYLDGEKLKGWPIHRSQLFHLELVNLIYNFV